MTLGVGVDTTSPKCGDSMPTGCDRDSYIQVMGDATDLGGVDEGVRAAENDCLVVRIQMTLGVGVDTTSPKCCDSMLLDVIEIHTSSDGSCKQD